MPKRSSSEHQSKKNSHFAGNTTFPKSARKSETKKSSSVASLPGARARSKQHRQLREASFALVCSDATGQFWDEPGWVGAARSGNYIRRPRPEELVPLPENSVLQYLPGRYPLAWPVSCAPQGDKQKLSMGVELPPEVLDGAFVLAAQLPSGWTRTLLPAWKRASDAEDLPIFGYTAVFSHRGELWCAAVQTENNPRWKPQMYGTAQLPHLIDKMVAQMPNNRIVRQLEICARDYGCYNAQNFFYGRWEGAAPVSPVCNAGCRGCISQQPDNMPPSPQIRLSFTPTLEEIVELGLRHLSHPDTIFSFGQGCEGEPLVQGPLIAEAIKAIRAKTSAGTLHINSNGSLPKHTLMVAQAGLNSLRVSLNSARREQYRAYYQPRGYDFEDVLESIRIARAHNVWVSINLLQIPGVNDTPRELEALVKLVNDLDVNMIQMRNLNMDPDLLFSQIPVENEPGVGINAMLRILQQEAPRVRIGNHNPTVNVTVL